MSIPTRPNQILMTFFNFLETLLKVVVQLPVQFTIKIFGFNFRFAPPQNTFPRQRDKNRLNDRNSATAHARCNFFSKDAKYPRSYLLSIH